MLVIGRMVSFQAFQGWGDVLRTNYGKSPSYKLSDFTINYLGYWTDNGKREWGRGVVVCDKCHSYYLLKYVLDHSHGLKICHYMYIDISGFHNGVICRKHINSNGRHYNTMKSSITDEPIK